MKKAKFYIPFSKRTMQINYDLVMYQNKYPEIFNDGYYIGAFYGSFGYTPWCGGSRNHIELSSYEYMNEVLNFMEQNNIPIRFAFTNSELTEKHLYDTYGNLMLELYNTGNNEVLVASELMENYIKTNYPKYKVVKSTCWSKTIPYDDSDRFYMSVLDRRKNADNEFLLGIEHKEKVEIVLNERCFSGCPFIFDHYKTTDESFLEYRYRNDYCEQHHINEVESEKNILMRLYNLRKTGKEYVTKDRLQNFFIPSGFSNFKIVGRNYSVVGLVNEIAYYMIKPEYQQDFCEITLNKLFDLIV